MRYLGLFIICLLSETLTAQNIEFIPYLAGDVKDAQAPLAKAAAARSQHWTHPTIWEYGILEPGIRIVAYFKFVNTGDQPLIITRSLTPCGCAYARPPKSPILPGEVGYIYAKCMTDGMQGNKEILIYVHSNAINQPHVKLSMNMQFPIEKHW